MDERQQDQRTEAEQEQVAKEHQVQQERRIDRHADRQKQVRRDEKYPTQKR